MQTGRVRRAIASRSGPAKAGWRFLAVIDRARPVPSGSAPTRTRGLVTGAARRANTARGRPGSTAAPSESTLLSPPGVRARLSLVGFS